MIVPRHFQSNVQRERARERERERERAKNGDFTNNKEEETHQIGLHIGERPASQRGSDFNSNSVQTRVTLLYSGIVARYTSINKLNKK